MMPEWRKFRELTPSDRRLLVRATIALPMVAGALHWLGVRRCQSILARLMPLRSEPAFGSRVVADGGAQEPNVARQGDSTASRLAVARGIARLVRVAATRGFYSANCLERSLVLWWLLRRQALPCEIRYGAQAGDRGFEAHAWVECANHVIGDHPNIRRLFAPFEPPMSLDQLTGKKPIYFH